VIGARLEVAQQQAVADHLRTGLEAIGQLDLDDALGAHHQRTVRERVRADRHEDDHGEGRVHDRTAAGERIGRRSRRGRDDEAVSAVRVDVGAVDPGAQVEHAATLALGHDDVVQRERGERAFAGRNRCLEQHARLRTASAMQCVVHALEHAVGAYVREESEPTTIHAEHRDAASRRHARGVEHRSIAADRDQHVGAEREFSLRHQRHGQQTEVDPEVVGRAHVPAALEQVRGEAEHGLGDPRVRRSPGERDGRKRGGRCVHGWPVF
jgi:hypothetical protein